MKLFIYLHSKEVTELQREIGSYRQYLSREMVSQANALIEDLNQCILNVGDEAVLHALKKSYDEFIKVFVAKDSGNEIIEHFYNNLQLNLIAALRHYDYISVIARSYVSAELAFTKAAERLRIAESKYKGEFAGIVPFRDCIEYASGIKNQLSTGQVPCDEELQTLDERITLCENVVEAL